MSDKQLTLKEALEAADLNVLFNEPFHDLIYGPPGSGKTTMIAMLAAWLWKHKKLKTRWIVGDGGFATIQNLGLVAAGAVEFCDYSHRPEPSTTLELLSEGYWPGKTMIQGTNFARLEAPTKDVFDQVGLWVFEGFSVGAQYLMSNLQGGFAARAAAGERFGPDATVKFADSIDVGGGKRSHGTMTGWAVYSQIQSVLLGCKRRTDNLPHTIWTTHEREAEDKTENESKWVGPEVAGKALTTKVAGLFGNTIHCTPVQKKTKGKDQFSGADIFNVQTIRRAYLSNHYDPDGTVMRQYVGNSRVFGLPEYFDLLTPQDSLKPWAKLAELKRAAVEVFT